MAVEPNSLSAAAGMDLYGILGIEESAGEAEIKSAYRKLALKYHPDRHTNSSPEVAHEAANNFKNISLAYTILLDPRKRQQYDTLRKQGKSGDLHSLTDGNQDLPSLDLDSMRMHERLLAAMLTKAGVALPTVVPPRVMDDALRIKDTAEKISLDVSREETLSKTEALFYRFEAKETDLQNGLAIRVISNKASRFKLLLFSSNATEIIQEEDCFEKDKATYAGIFLIDAPNYHYEPNENRYQHTETPSMPLFRRLDHFHESAKTIISPGIHLFCVLGINFFNNVECKIEIVTGRGDSTEIPSIIDTNEKIKQKQLELARFESEYMETKRKWEEAEKKYAKENEELDNLLNARHNAYSSFGKAPTPMARREPRSSGFWPFSLK